MAAARSRLTARARGELAEHDAERMRAVELVVAVARDDQRRHRLDATAKQPQHVERGLVRPVQVLEHEDGRSVRLQFARQRRHDLVRLHSARHDLLELAAACLGDAEQRAERARREERVAAAPEDPRRAAALFAELSQERGLADPCLAADEHDVPARAPLDGPQRIVERRKLAGALEQLRSSQPQVRWT